MPSLPSAGSGERAPLGHSLAHWVTVSVQEGEQALPQAPAGGGGGGGCKCLGRLQF